MAKQSLNVQVAELVMGWPEVYEGEDGRVWGVRPHESEHVAAPDFTDAGGVGEVLSQLARLGYKVRIKSYMARYRIGGVIPTMWKVALICDGRIWEKRSSSLGRAVCNVALLAMEER